MILHRYKTSYNKLWHNRSVFDLKDFTCYYHDFEPTIYNTRKSAVRFIKESGGRYALNLSLQNADVTKHSGKLFVSEHKVNLIVCDESLLREVISMLCERRD